MPNTGKRPRVESDTSTSSPARKRRAAEEKDSDEENGDKVPLKREELSLSQQPDFRPMPAKADVGIIESVSLRNFMCHSKLDVNLKPSVNFIIGQNGSGKSAIMTGLVVGLGGKASTTSRGTSVKSFIKTGRQSAEVVVKLRNVGQDAYKPDEYGKSIVVERKLSSEGLSQYRLKSHDGKRVVSTKREELSHILDQFNIQVDNPISVLNQDTSRHFLHSKSPHDKYKFFLKATQLEQMKNDYLNAGSSKDVAEDILKQKTQTLPTLQQEVMEWEQKFKSLQSLDSLRTKVDQLKNEMAWALVHEREKEVEAAHKELAAEEARTPKFKAKQEQSQQNLERLNSEYKNVQEQVTTMANQVKDLEPQNISAKKARDTKKASVRTKQMELRKCIHSFNSTLQDKTQIAERIEEIKSSAQQDYGKEKKARDERIKKILETIKDFEATRNTKGQDLDQYRRAILKSREDIQQLKSDEDELRQRVEQVRRHQRTLEAARKNAMSKFGAWMPNLLQQIDTACRRGRFHKKPRGPLGATMKLHVPQWALAVECCLGGLLQAFCVHDHHDERELEKIFAMVCPEGKKPTTITSPFQETVYNVSKNRPRCPQYPTVLEVLKIEDPVVANCLIDQRSVEAVILIKNTEESRNFMTGEGKRINCREAFNLEGDQLYSKPTFRYYSANQNKANILTADLEQDIRAAQDEVRRMSHDLNGMSENIRQLNTEMQRNQGQERDCQNRVDQLGRDIGQKQFELDELRSREDATPVDVTTLEEEVGRYTEQLEDLAGRKTKLEGEMAAARSELEAAEDEYKHIDGQIKSVTTKFDEIKEDLVARETKLETAKATKRHYDGKMKEHDRNLDMRHKAHEGKKKLLEEDIVKASQICERITTQRKAQNIESEIQQINKRIKTEEKNRGSAEEITTRYYETCNNYTCIKKEVSQLGNFLKRLELSLAERQNNYGIIRLHKSTAIKYCFCILLGERRLRGRLRFNHKDESVVVEALDVVMKNRNKQYSNFRQMIALRAKYYFIVMLSNRNYSGKIQFDHSKESLTMSVQPNIANSKLTHDLKSLSGGERSFATVCFILALWDTMDSPFRCLDEFDVFMDMVNRRISMDMMMDVALKHRGHQFIFLTPQDMSFMQSQQGVYIWRMPNPERGLYQTTLQSVRRDEDDEEAGPSNR